MYFGGTDGLSEISSEGMPPGINPNLVSRNEPKRIQLLTRQSVSPWLVPLAPLPRSSAKRESHVVDATRKEFHV
jgi:hypothetical protein